MITARADTPADDNWEYTDSKRNKLYSLLDDTIYSHGKKKQFEYLIQGELTQEKYQNFKTQFWEDRIDGITMKGTDNLTAIKRRVGKLK